MEWVDMEKRERVLQAADRAAARKLIELQKRTPQAMFEANGAGALHGSRHIIHEKEICVEGFREICEVAADVVAEIEHENAPSYAQALRTPLLVHQLAVDRLFQQSAAPGQSPVKDWMMQQLGPFHIELDAALDDVLANLELGIVGGRSVASRKPSGDISIDGAGQVMVNSPGGQQSVSGDLLVKSGIDTKELLSVLSGLRGEVSAINAPERDTVEDAIVNVEREVASVSPSPSRIKRLGSGVIDIAGKVGISTAGGFLARLAVMMAGIG